MINASYDDHGWDDRVRQAIRTLPATMATAAQEQLAELADAVRAGLSGRYLDDRRGVLAEALEGEVGTGSSEISASLTCAVPYAAYQNYGFSGSEQVESHLRTISVVYGRPLATPVEAMVGPSVRQVDYAGTGFMSEPFAEAQDAIVSSLAEAVAGLFES